MGASLKDRVADLKRMLELRRIQPIAVIPCKGSLIACITEADARRVIDTYGTASDIPGLFLVESGTGWITGIDNSDGCAYCEDFRTPGGACRWLTTESTADAVREWEAES